MRQAGRYLPEYQVVRERAGGFLAMAMTPELAAEVTLQPVRRFDVDAAVLFSDILVPLQAMGMDLRFDEGRGPAFSRPIRSAAAIESLKPVEPERDLAYVGEALRLVDAELPASKALLGFAGAPFTLAAYAVEGGNPGAGMNLRSLMYRETALFDLLMEKLAVLVSAHLRYQVSCGARAIVLFDTWAGQLTPDDYRTFVAPWNRRILEDMDGVAPRMVFVRGGSHLMDDVVADAPEAIVIDWRTPITEAFKRWGDRVAIQGNLDPAALLSTPEDVYRRTRALLAEVGGRPGHILSLGHGVLRMTDPECVAAFVAAARDES
jgi:uroporphyrinogen decarboxylase